MKFSNTIFFFFYCLFYFLPKSNVLFLVVHGLQNNILFKCSTENELEVENLRPHARFYAEYYRCV